jgi:hypothetical protein
MLKALRIVGQVCWQLDVRNIVSDNSLYEQWIAKSTAAEKLWRRFLYRESCKKESLLSQKKLEIGQDTPANHAQIV